MIKATRLLILSCLLSLPSCTGFVVATAVDTTIAVVKVPFRVAGAAVDVVIPDNDEDGKADARDN